MDEQRDVIEQQPTSCSQCGHEFGCGPHGFSHCENHLPFSNPHGDRERVALKLFRCPSATTESFKQSIYTRRKTVVELINKYLFPQADESLKACIREAVKAHEELECSFPMPTLALRNRLAGRMYRLSQEIGDQP